MTSTTVRIERRRRSDREIDAVESGIRDWHKQTKGDTFPSQARALGGALSEAAAVLRAQLAQLDAADDATFFAGCARHDAAVAWLRRLFDYYRVRIDQRRDPKLGPVLRAADEIVWSCYCPAFPEQIPARPAPLTFFEPATSPWALESSKQFLEPLTPTGSAAKLIERMPIPLIAIPYWVAHSPWWLVHLAHETGHHVLSDTHAEAAFGGQVADAATARAPERATAWRGWTAEIFADLWSAAAMGRWALSALADSLRGPVTRLVSSDYKYPAPVVRLRLMQCFVEKRYGAIPASSVWWSLPAEASVDVKTDWDVACDVARALESGWKWGVIFEDLEATIDAWATELAAGRDAWNPGVETARLLACSAFEAWGRTSSEDRAASDAAREDLADRFTRETKKNAPPGERGASADSAKGAPSLAAALLELSTAEAGE